MEVPISQDNHGLIGYYTTEKGYNYVDTFNKDWIDNHQELLSGPEYCSNCYCYGTIKQDGVTIFLGYCLNCAAHLYQHERGLGFQGFSSNDIELINNYDYPNYLEKYKISICSLTHVQSSETKNNSISSKVDYKDYVNYINYIDCYNCDRDFDW